MDTIGWFIATSHSLLGHDKTAMLIGQPIGDRAGCLLCQYEADPCPERKQAVISVIGTGRP